MPKNWNTLMTLFIDTSQIKNKIGMNKIRANHSEISRPNEMKQHSFANIR